MFEFLLPDISCGHCVAVVQKTVKLVDHNATVDVDLSAKRVRIESSVDRALFANALVEAGYAPSGTW